MSEHHPPRPATLPGRSFAIVASEYNPLFVQGLIDAVRGELEKLSPGAQIALHRVPGAFEIPVVVQEVALQGAAEAIIALGVIIRGSTAHADLIGQSVTDSLQQIALRQRTPVIHEVLLVADEAQARTRTLEGEKNRGVEAARAAVRVLQAMDAFPGRRA